MEIKVDEIMKKLGYKNWTDEDTQMELKGQGGVS
jgi:hypothetical protein